MNMNIICMEYSRIYLNVKIFTTLGLAARGDGLAGVPQNPYGFLGESGALCPVCHERSGQHDGAGAQSFL